ncbi:MAG: DUF5723 family protein [Bacteroidales bacterium]|jgi:hypothetical protein|nr:DUF5723 family protein [Bacteroidales bacterium]
MQKLYINLLLSIGISSLCLLSPLQAQVSSPAGFMHYHPLFSGDNPARFTHANGYVGLPGYSNLQIKLLNSLVKLNHMLRYDHEGYPTAIDLDNWVDKLKLNNNWLRFELNEELIGFGFREKFLFFTVSFNFHADAGLKASKDLFGLFVKGNMNYLGDQTAELKAMVNANAYTELSLGVQAQVNKRIYIGARPRLLFGLAQVRTKSLEASVHTNPETYDVTLKYSADAEARSVLPLLAEDNTLQFGQFNVADMLGKMGKNMGFAIDLGAVYRINQRFGVELSVHDLGFIRWRTEGVRFQSAVQNGGNFYENGSFKLSGLTSDIVKAILNQDNKPLNNFIDSLSSYFPNDLKQTTGSWTTMLNTRIHIGGYFDLTPKHRFMVQMQGLIIGKSFLPAVTVAYSGRISDFFDISVPYTIMPGSYDNLGLGIGFNIYGLYLYAATQNALFMRRGLGSQLNLQLGIVVNWGYKKAQEQVLKPIDRIHY